MRGEGFLIQSTDFHFTFPLLRSGWVIAMKEEERDLYVFWNPENTEVYSESRQTSTMKLFVKIVNGFQFHLRCLTVFWMYGCSFAAKLSWKKIFKNKKHLGFWRWNIHYLQKKCFYIAKKFYTEIFFYWNKTM